MKVVYAGTEWDTRFLNTLTHYKDFVLLDCYPSNTLDNNLRHQLFTDIKHCGFGIVSQEDDLMTLYNQETSQNIKYISSCALPEFVDNKNGPCKDILGWNGIIVAGYDPPHNIMNFADQHQPLTFIGFSGIDFGSPSSNDSLITYLNDGKYLDKFEKYIYYTNDSASIFNSWSGFVKYANIQT
jgi:hypothetical protein